MAKSRRTDWTREQLIQVLALYCQIPFGQMYHRNPVIQEVAAKIGRTPSAVAFKLSNFASLDPYHKARGIKGMQNSSVTDRKIWNEYYGHWEQLADVSPLDAIVVATEIAESPLQTPAGPTEILRTQKNRIGQAFFRNAVLAAYQLKCCITGITALPLLRASHIIPWADAPADRLNPRNGLCLNVLHDSAFDRGYITIATDLTLILSKRLKSAMPSDVYSSMFARYEHQHIATAEKFPPLDNCIAHHRNHIFQP